MRSMARRAGLRVLAVAILLSLLAVPASAIIWPVSRLFADQKDDIERSLELLANYRAIAAQRPSLEAELAELDKKSSIVPGLIDANTTALATEKLQNDLRALIETHGGKIRSAQTLPISAVMGFDKIAIRYDFAIPTLRFRDLSYQLDTHLPFLFVDAVELHVYENPTLNNPDLPPPDIDVRWTVTSYRWAGAS